LYKSKDGMCEWGWGRGLVYELKGLNRVETDEVETLEKHAKLLTFVNILPWTASLMPVHASIRAGGSTP